MTVLDPQDWLRQDPDPDTRAEYERLKAVANTPREVMKPMEPPAGFKKKVLDEIRRQKRSKS